MRPVSLGGQTYHQLAKHFWFQRPDTTIYNRFEVNDPNVQLIPMIDAGVMSMLRVIDVVGGDVLTRRAFENSHALDHKRTRRSSLSPKRNSRLQKQNRLSAGLCAEGQSGRRNPKGRRRIRQPSR